MNVLWYRLWKNIAACFTSSGIVAQLVAIALTYGLVISGFDWWWYVSSRFVPAAWLYPGVALGGLLPMLVPLCALVIGVVRKNKGILRFAGTVGQSAFLGWLFSSVYKAFTGRAHPSFGATLTTDTSHVFHFGFLKGGIFWGWPSSHTTVAFAMAVALAVVYGKHASVKYPALLYALYVGLAVSVSIHWFSDFVAGAIIGTVVGLAVGRGFKRWLTI